MTDQTRAADPLEELLAADSPPPIDPSAVQRVEEILASDEPPLAPLGPTTDYRQLLLAWAKRHGLSLEEALQRLAAQPDPAGQRWAEKITHDMATQTAMEHALEAPDMAVEPNVRVEEVSAAETVANDDI